MDKPIRLLSIRQLLSTTTLLIKSDYILVVPYMIFHGLNQLFDIYFWPKHTQVDTLLSGGLPNRHILIVKFLIIGWLCDLLFRSILLSYGVHLLKKTPIQVDVLFHRAKRVFIRSVIGSSLFLLPLFLLSFLEFGGGSSGFFEGIILFLVMLVILPFSICTLFFYPIVLVYTGDTWKAALKYTIQFLLKHPRPVIYFFALVLCFLFIVNIIGALFAASPHLMVFVIITNGIGGTFTYLMGLVFYHSIHHSSPVTLSEPEESLT